jgi:uncharacterized protein (DUF1330 family)
MTALFVVELTVKNADKLKEYSAQTPAILKKFNGALLMKGKPSQIHASTNPSAAYDTVVVFQFPSKEEALGWYNSPEYQALLPLRDEAMDSSFKLAA